MMSTVGAASQRGRTALQGNRLASPQQRRFYAVHQPVITPLSEVITAVIDLPPRTSTDVIAAAAKHIILRHDALQVSFHQDGNDLWQVDELDPSIAVEEVHLTGAGEQWQDALEKYMQAEAARLYDPRCWPMFRFTVVRLPTGHDICFLHINHLVFDGLSRRTFEREFPEVVHRLQCGEDKQDPRPFPYRDYCLWANAREKSPEFTSAQEYWRSEFIGSFEPFHLSASHTLDAEDTVTLGYVFRLPGQALAANELAKNHHSTVFMCLLASFCAWLSRWTGRDRSAVGISTSGRDHPQVGNVIGMFTNSVVVQVPSESAPADVIKTVQRKVDLSLQHQCYQYDSIVRDLGLELTLNRLPLSGVYFTSHKLHLRRPFAEGELAYTYVDGSKAKFDLLAFYQIVKDDIIFSLKYRKGIFPGNKIELFADGYRDLLAEWLHPPAH